MKTVLITGAAGFVGAHLCDRALAMGLRVIGMDNMITGNMANIEHLLPLPDFKFLHHDITNFVHVSGNLDYILHFASPASPVDYLKYPIQTLKVGALGTYNLLGLAKEKSAKILIASTSEVYGDPLVHPQKEDYWGNVNCVGPRGVYDEAKRYQEAITMAYHQTHGLQTAIARIFNTYGPKMRLNDGRVMPNFITNGLANEDIEIYGDGNQTRSFCYIDDTVDAVFKLLFANYHLPVNIGGDVELSIAALAQKVIDATNSSSNLHFSKKRKDDPYRRKPDISLAKRILDWSPNVTLESGLRNTVRYFQQKAQEC